MSKWTPDQAMLSDLMEITEKYKNKMNCLKMCEILMAYTFNEIIECTNSNGEAKVYAYKLIDKEMKLIIEE